METRFRTTDSLRQGDPVVIGHPGKLVMARPSCGIDRTLRFTGIAPNLICLNEQGKQILYALNIDNPIAYDCECGKRHISDKMGMVL